MQRLKAFCEITKTSVNQLNDSVAQDQLHRLGTKAIGLTLGTMGWRIEHAEVSNEKIDNGYLYTGKMQFRKSTAREYTQEVFDKQWDTIQRKVASGGKTWGWFLKGGSGFPPRGDIPQQEVIAQTSMEIETPEDYMRFFKHLYGLDAQIRIIYDAVKSAKRTNFLKRNAVILFGSPGCGKTDTLLAFRHMLGENSCFTLDATSMTKAGAEKLLLELENVPPILIIEEIEKCNPLNLPWLLGVMDQRAEIHKVNARIGSVKREARCLVLATANNFPEFQGIMSGALASRFKHPVAFPRPSREVLEKIMQRECREIDGNPAWVKPALDYALNVERTDDPRRLMAILDGGDRLLSGEYQKDLISIRSAMAREAQQASK